MLKTVIKNRVHHMHCFRVDLEMKLIVIGPGEKHAGEDRIGVQRINSVTIIILGVFSILDRLADSKPIENDVHALSRTLHLHGGLPNVEYSVEFCP